MGVRVGSWWPQAVSQGAGVPEELVDRLVSYFWQPTCDITLGGSLLVSLVHWICFKCYRFYYAFSESVFNLKPVETNPVTTLSLFLSDRCVSGEVNATVSGIATTFRSEWTSDDLHMRSLCLLHDFKRVKRSATTSYIYIAYTFKENLSDHKGHILQTCSDCLLWTDTFRNGDVTGRYILQFSKFLIGFNRVG